MESTSRTLRDPQWPLVALLPKPTEVEVLRGFLPPTLAGCLGIRVSEPLVIGGEVSVSRTGRIQFAEGEASEPKLGRLLCGSYSEVLVPLGGITLPIHLEGGDLAFFDCAIGPCQGRGALPAVSSVLFRISVKFSVKAPDVQSLAAVLVSNRP